jgi:hypothetical protein
MGTEAKNCGVFFLLERFSDIWIMEGYNFFFMKGYNIQGLINSKKYGFRVQERTEQRYQSVCSKSRDL